MARRIFLGAVLVAVLDLYLLYRIGRGYGLGAVLLLVLLPAVVGVRLAWRQGRRCLARVHEELAAGRLPQEKVAEAPVILAAGLLMLYPGPLTTALGLLLLIPGVRRLAARHVVARPGGFVSAVSFGGPRFPGGEVVKDVEAREVDSAPDGEPPAPGS